MRKLPEFEAREENNLSGTYSPATIIFRRATMNYANFGIQGRCTVFPTGNTSY